MTRLNRTESFYCADDPSLLWEMTVCQCLASGDSAYAKALTRPASYGRLVGEFLQLEAALPEQPGQIIEVGGGYGSLMAGLLEVVQPRKIRAARLTSSARIFFPFCPPCKRPSSC